MKARIMGTGSYLPKLRVSNDDLSKLVDTSDEWIKSRTGIETRHLAVEETTTSMSVEAAKLALENAGVEPQELDLILAATLTADHIVPFLSCEVQSAIGANRAAAYDMAAGCSGFIFALHSARAYIESGMCKKILVIGTEMLSKIVDWTDRSTCVLFGDGSGAAVVCADEEDGILSSVQGSDGSRGNVLFCGGRPLNNPYASQEAENPYVQMDGREVYKFAVRTVPDAIAKAMEEAGVTQDEISCYLLHQANQRIIEAVAKRLKQPMEKFPMCIAQSGNISAATVPILLDKVNREGRLKRKDKIVLSGFGAGLTWGATVLTW